MKTKTIVAYAQELVDTLLKLMPSIYQRDSLQALLGLFLEAQGHPLPEHCQVKSAAALSRFLNHYDWSTRSMIRAVRQAMVQQVLNHLPSGQSTLKVIIDLTTLEKRGKFRALHTPTLDPDLSQPWVCVLNGKRGIHLVSCYLVVGQWRVPWSFRLWRGKGQPSPTQLALKLLGTLPAVLTKRFKVIVLADAGFASKEFLNTLQKRRWRAVVGIRLDRRIKGGGKLKQLYRNGRRGQQVSLIGITQPLTVSWFWFKRDDGKRELRFVISTYPYSGIYLVRLGRKRWAIEGFFKTIKHRFGLHQVGQKTKLGIYRWLVLSLIAFVLAHWISRCQPACCSLNWGKVSAIALKTLLPQVVWIKLLRHIRSCWNVINQQGFEVIVKPLPWVYRECCKI